MPAALPPPAALPHGPRWGAALLRSPSASSATTPAHHYHTHHRSTHTHIYPHTQVANLRARCEADQRLLVQFAEEKVQLAVAG